MTRNTHGYSDSSKFPALLKAQQWAVNADVGLFVIKLTNSILHYGYSSTWDSYLSVYNTFPIPNDNENDAI